MSGALAILASALFLWAAVTDLASRLIPNRIVLLLAGLGVLRLGLDAAKGAAAPGLAADFAVAAALLAGGMALNHARLLGGGDVKLLAAGALWLGATATLPFLAWTALAGGLLALVWILRRRHGAQGTSASLPYGVAIAAAGIAASLGVI